MKKVVATGLVAAMAVLSLTGCGGGSTLDSQAEGGTGGDGSQVEIRFSWWGSEARHEATLEAIELYESQNPGVKIIPEYSSFDGYQDKLMAQVAGGNAPDVFTCIAEWYPALYNSNAMTELNDKIDWSYYDEGTVQSCSYEDKIYGACVSQNAMGIYYNKTIADKYGIQIPEGDYTWNDLVKLMEEVYIKSDGEVYGMNNPLKDGWTLQAYGYTELQKPAPYMWDNEKLTVTAEDMTAYLKFVESMPEGCLLPPEESFNFDVFTAAPIAQGLTLFETDSMGTFAPIQSQTDDTLGILPLPVGPNGETANEGRPGLILSVYSGSKVQDEAAKFIDWFVNSPEAAKILKMTRGVLPTSIQREAVLEEEGILDEYDVVIMEAVNKALSGEVHPFLPGPLGADAIRETIVKKIGQEFAFGELTAEQAGQKFMEEANKALLY